MELTPLVQTATDTAQATKGIDWSAVIPTAIGAAIALAGVGVSQIVSYRLKKQELEHQRREANLKRVQDSAEKYLAKLSEVNSVVRRISYKSEALKIRQEDLSSIMRVIDSDKIGEESLFRIFEELQSRLEKSMEAIDTDLIDLERLVSVELSSIIVLYEDGSITFGYLNSLLRLIAEARRKFKDLSENALQITNLKVGITGEYQTIKHMSLDTLGKINLSIKEFVEAIDAISLTIHKKQTIINHKVSKIISVPEIHKVS